MPTSNTAETVLTLDHSQIDALYDAYTELASSHSELSIQAFAAYRAALEVHMRCEEELVFPALEGNPLLHSYHEVPTLIEEHRSIRHLLEQVTQLLSERSLTREACERRLFEELHEHNAREEMLVYPEIDRTLSETHISLIEKQLRKENTNG